MRHAILWLVLLLALHANAETYSVGGQSITVPGTRKVVLYNNVLCYADTFLPVNPPKASPKPAAAEATYLVNMDGKVVSLPVSKRLVKYNGKWLDAQTGAPFALPEKVVKPEPKPEPKPAGRIDVDEFGPAPVSMPIPRKQKTLLVYMELPEPVELSCKVTRTAVQKTPMIEPEFGPDRRESVRITDDVIDTELELTRDDIVATKKLATAIYEFDLGPGAHPARLASAARQLADDTSVEALDAALKLLQHAHAIAVAKKK